MASNIDFICPHCNTDLSATTDDAGAELDCPSCSNPIRVPAPEAKRPLYKDRICANCGFVGEQKYHTKGSIVIELFLWLMFCFPGLLYSVWRLTSRTKVCPQCQQPGMLPQSTPKGKQMFRDQGYKVD